MYQEQSSLQLEQLTEENTALRNRLRDVAHSPLSDNEKQQLLYESHRHHNSAPASIATNPLDDGSCGDATACPTPDWDKHSSSNVSEISVACLQDKINQMQETHYSTNEELQATLQELTDLQRQLTELQQENERLLEEKNLMFDSLCRQTERLKDTRQEVESLKTLIYREKDETEMESAQEREEKLVDLLKSAQDEHESLISKHEQLSGELQDLRDSHEALHDQLKAVTDRNGTLESTLDAKNAEQKLLDQELTQARDQCNGKQIEINRLKDLLENARTKINELEQDRAMSDKSELDELLDNARKEKDALESEVANLKEQLARSKNEIEKLKEQVSILQEECKVIRNNARTIQSDLDYKYEKLVSEKNALAEQLHKFQDIINELQMQAQCQEEDKRNLSDVLAETQRNLSESERKIISLENELADVKKLRKEENEEWEKFQNDLLTSVRVANDFKTEAQQDLQKMIMENKEHRDKVRQLEAQLDKLKGDPAMPEGRRNSQPNQRQNAPRRIFGSLPNLLDTIADKEHVGKTPKRAKWMRHHKKLSQGEEKILESLHEMYREIDPEKPESQLTSEQSVIKKLKNLYENDSTAYKPVAPRKKQELAISKPLLESVYTNPKLESIAKNPNMKTLETDRFSWMGHKRFSDDIAEDSNNQNSKSIPKPTKGFVSYLQTTPESSPRVSHSKNRHTSFDDTPREFPLRRYSSKEDLTGIAELDSFKRTSSQIPGKRSSLKSFQSDASSNISQRKRVSFDEKRNSCVLIKEFLSFESMEDIYKNIDPKVPEEKLTKEQRFALRLKTSMDNIGQKPDLRKRPTFKKSKVFISSPLKESVLKNTKLLSIIRDPIVRTAGDNVESEIVELRKVHRMKKYLGDINRVLRNPSKRMCKQDWRLSRSVEDIRSFPYVFKRISSSMENLPSEGGIEPKIEIKVVTKVLPEQCFAASLNVSSGSSSFDNSVEDLAGKSEEIPVVFIEHFESEKSRYSGAVKEESSVQIKDISGEFVRHSVDVHDEEQTGRISFPEEEEDVCRLRLLSINSAEMEEDDVLARYKQISEYHEAVSENESPEESPKGEDSHSFYSVELKAVEVDEPNSDEQNWLSKYLDQTCEVEDRKENRKMRVLYKDVVKEIKRKYSQDQQCPSDSSDDENVHILNTKDGKIEVRQLDDEDSSESNFFDRFFKTKPTFSVQNDPKDIENVDTMKFDENLLPSEEKKYISNVREMYKEEFEDLDRLGYTDTESDHYKKLLCRQNALDICSQGSTAEKEMENFESSYLGEISKLNKRGGKLLSPDELKLISTAKKRNSRPISEINVDDLAFIESMKDKYLKDEYSGSKHLGEMETFGKLSSYSSVYVKYFTENFLLEEIKNNTSNPEEGNIFTSESPTPNTEDIQLSTAQDHSYHHLKCSTEAFLQEEINHSIKEYQDLREACNTFKGNNIMPPTSFKYSYLAASTQTFLNEEINFYNCNCYLSDLSQSSENSGLAEKRDESNSSSWRSYNPTSFSDFYLKFMTSNFLSEEVNHNTYFEELSPTTKSMSAQDENTPSRSNSISKIELVCDPELRPSKTIRHSSVNLSDWDMKNDEEPSKMENRSKSTFGIRGSDRSKEVSPEIRTKWLGQTFTELTPRNSGVSSCSTDCRSWTYVQPLYANYHEMQLQNSKNVQEVIPRKPKPLPRKSSRDFVVTSIRSKTDIGSSMTRNSDIVTNVKTVKNEALEDLLPNSSKVMVEPEDALKTTNMTSNPESIAISMDTIGSSNVMVRKTKKFIKDGDTVDEFDEASGVYNFRIDNILDNEKFDTKSQIIPESLIDYADSESKITLFDIDNSGLTDFQEACSRPQTSRQRSTPFRLSYYGEDDEAEALKEATPKTSKEKVALLKQKFENLSSEEMDRTSKDIQKENLTKLLNDKAAYDLVFKTESKYWFDNVSERLDGSIQTSNPCFDSSPLEKPLNITILDPIESKTNANYQHLFENETKNRAVQKTFAGSVKLSEMNLKTSIPCVDFTNLNSPIVEKGSNASLYNFGMGSEGGSGKDGAT